MIKYKSNGLNGSFIRRSIFLIALIFPVIFGERANAADEIRSEIVYPNPSPDILINQGIMGRLVIYGDDSVKNNSLVTIKDFSVGKRGRSFVVGGLQRSEGFQLALIPGEYQINIDSKSSIFSDPVYRVEKIYVEGGKTVYARASGDKIFLETAVTPSLISIGKAGSLYLNYEIKEKIQAKINIVNSRGGINPTTNLGYVVLAVRISQSKDVPVFKLNGENIVESSFSAGQHFFTINYVHGKNVFSASAYGIDGVMQTETFSHYEKTLAELERDMKDKAIEEAAVENKRRDEIIQRNIKLENEAKARRAEQERVARDGDGTPDDLSCKKYGLLPQSQGYAECRMRLDLIRKESQARNTFNDRAKDEALRSRNEAIERQNSIVANRESQCQFVKAQEYLRPVAGGFFQSMQNAESAFSNCMAGVPQIQTTCSQDVFGNINCNSR